MTPIVTLLDLFYTHSHAAFSRFYALLCALVTINTPYAIYFFLIHNCTNGLSSLHIFVHHCTFCASLHTKTSPVTSVTCNPRHIFEKNTSIYSYNGQATLLEILCLSAHVTMPPTCGI